MRVPRARQRRASAAFLFFTTTAVFSPVFLRSAVLCTTYHFVEDLNALSEFLPSVRHRVALPSGQHLALLRLQELPNVQVVPAPPPPIASLLWLRYEHVGTELGVGGWETRQSTGGMCAVIYLVTTWYICTGTAVHDVESARFTMYKYMLIPGANMVPEVSYSSTYVCTTAKKGRRHMIRTLGGC